LHRSQHNVIFDRSRIFAEADDGLMQHWIKYRPPVLIRIVILGVCVWALTPPQKK
jgi:hypothetical protein